MSWLSWIVVGFIAGALAKGVTGVKGAGCIGTILIGIAGGILGGIVFSAAARERAVDEEQQGRADERDEQRVEAELVDALAAGGRRSH